MDYEALISLTASYLGITDSDMTVELSSYVRAAVVLITMQTGEATFTDDASKQLVCFTAAQMYADRFGELSNKSGSATAQIMQNLTFALQQKNRRKAVDIENSDNS